MGLLTPLGQTPNPNPSPRGGEIKAVGQESKQ